MAIPLPTLNRKIPARSRSLFPERLMKRSRQAVKMMLISAGTLISLASSSFALSLTKNQDLEFGRFVGGAGCDGTVTIDASGGRRASGKVRVLTSPFSPARFSLYGTPGESYTLTLPTALTLVSGGEQMEVSALTCSVPISGTIPPSGLLAIALGGTLTVKLTQRNSPYVGTLILSAAGN